MFTQPERRVVDLGRAKLILGDGVAEMEALAGQFTAIISDPPYGMGIAPTRLVTVNGGMSHTVNTICAMTVCRFDCPIKFSQYP